MVHAEDRLEDDPVAGTDATDAHAAIETAHDQHAGGHGGETLGPIDWRAWGAAAVGAVAALIVAGALYLTTHPS